MLKQWIPNLMLPSQIDVRKGSTKRLSNSFAALRLLATMIPEHTKFGIVQALSYVITNLDNMFQYDVDLFIKTIKGCGTFFRAWISGKWLSMKECGFTPDTWHALENGRGCPEIIWPLFEILRSMQQPNGLIKKWVWKAGSSLALTQLILAVCNLHRVIQVPADPNIKSITAKNQPDLTSFKETDTLNAIDFIFKDRHRFRALLAKNVAKARMNMPTSSGPNGKALWDAHLDAYAVMSDTVLLGAIEAFCDVLGMDHLINVLYANISAVETRPAPKDKPVHSRLHYIEELGGKTRVVAIVDYWSQLVLSPLHDTIAELLRDCPMDGTFNQDAICEKVRVATIPNTAGIHSLDLTNATDALPIKLQSHILNMACADKSTGDKWARVMVDRDFHLPSGGTVRYNTGQPMGAKSSFPMLALTHHVIVWFAAKAAGKHDFTAYVILGDDIVIFDDGVAAQYRIIMANLNVSINETKSLSVKTGETGAAEICKRIYVSGFEVSTIPIKLISKTCEKGSLATSLHNEMAQRGHFTDPDNLLEFVVGLIDRRSAIEYLRYNNLPSSISSINKPSRDPEAGGLPENWFPAYPLNEADLFAVWKYTIAVEALKRLDNIARQAFVIESACKGATDFTKGIPMVVDTLAVNADTQARLRNLAAGKRHSHPAMEAAQEEVARITSILSRLQSGELSVASVALGTLVDTFRSPLIDTVAPRDEATADVNRMMLERFLGNLERAVNRTALPKHTLSFTQLLTTINRVWTVRATLGEGFFLNSVATRVKSSASAARLEITSLRNSITMGRVK